MRQITTIITALIFLSCFCPHPCHALQPQEVLVVANLNAASSIGLAKYYMEQRGIPAENLLVLWVSDQETVSREDYEKKIAKPIKEYLAQPKNNNIHCLVLLYGLPLRIATSQLTGNQQKLLNQLKTEESILSAKLAGGEGHGEERDQLEKRLTEITKQIKNLNTMDQSASVDSELTLVKVDGYPLKGWLPNPVFIGFKDQKLAVAASDIVLTSRIDGPSEDVVKRIIDDSIAAEQNGLTGNACFDARWPMPPDPTEKVSGYAFYDRSIHQAAAELIKNKLLPVIINSEQELFQAGDCPDTALYCGWYSLGQYVDAFTWKPGAIGYHIASGECTTLKKKDSQVWCKMMLEKGAAATIGPVNEPYVNAFPVPEIFFNLITEKGLGLGESYLLSLPYLSWQMVLVGDPLYRPFKKQVSGARSQVPVERQKQQD